MSRCALNVAPVAASAEGPRAKPVLQRRSSSGCGWLGFALVAVLGLPAGAEAAPALSADLDGDGKAESIAALPGKVTAGAAAFECGYDGFTCAVSVVDVHPGDKRKELVICGEAPRVDRSCDLYVYEGGALRLVPVKSRPDDPQLGALKITAPGNGHLMVESWERLYTRLEKYEVDAKFAELRLVRQPFQTVGYAARCQGQLTLHLEVGGGPVVATTKADSSVTVLLEDGLKAEHFLVKSATGLLGWVHIDALVGACEQVRMTYSAG